MAYKALMLVESVTKAKLIGGWLAKDGIVVKPTVGHIMVLDVKAPREEVVDVKNGYKAKQVMNPKNKDNTKEIIKLAKTVDTLILATDPDREGEGIAQDVVNLLKKEKALPKNVKRVTYHEVTPKAVKHAIENSGDINYNLVQAQNARRNLDYIFGFYISPLLWKRLSPGLSAGRVQSPALHMLSHRELEIKDFKPQYYWDLFAEINYQDSMFQMKLNQLDFKTLDKMHFKDKEEADDVKKELDKLIETEKLVIDSVAFKDKSVKPKPPYTTSTLQIDAVRKLRWSSSKVMSVAQSLFEGKGSDHGLITYHRTDSTTLSEEALKEIHGYLTTHYLEDKEGHYVQYATKAKNAQEAHEAIRPTSINLLPDEVKLGEDEKKLYKMIWQRAVASQMKPDIYRTLTVTGLLGNKYGYTVSNTQPQKLHAGKVYTESKDVDDEGETVFNIPNVQRGDKLTVKRNIILEHVTKPPARYNDATLIKELEANGIGRPSTYATILKTLVDRGYVESNKSRLTVRPLGLEVNQYLEEEFNEYLDSRLTAEMEDGLDRIATGKEHFDVIMRQFYNHLIKKVTEQEKVVQKKYGLISVTEETCPKCGVDKLGKYLGRYGEYLKCQNKKCDYKKSLGEKQEKPVEYTGEECPKCNGKLIYVDGRFGRYIACENKPDCDFKKPLKPKAPSIDTGVQCPECQKANILIRKGKKNVFFACGGFPKHKRIFSKEDYMLIAGKTEEEVKVQCESLK